MGWIGQKSLLPKIVSFSSSSSCMGTSVWGESSLPRVIGLCTSYAYTHINIYPCLSWLSIYVNI